MPKKKSRRSVLGGAYLIHRYHGDSNRSDFSNLSSVYIVSIDPAVKNLGVYVEHRCMVSGTTRTLEMHKFDISPKNDKGSDLFYNLINCFQVESLDYYCKNCHYVVVEKQSNRNYDCIRVSQAIISYFLFIDNPNRPYIIEYSPTSRRAAAKRLYCRDIPSGDAYKRWVTSEVLEIMGRRDDSDGMNIYNSLKSKRTDIADCLFQVKILFMHLKEQSDLGKETGVIINEMIDCL